VTSPPGCSGVCGDEELTLTQQTPLSCGSQLRDSESWLRGQLTCCDLKLNFLDTKAAPERKVSTLDSTVLWQNRPFEKRGLALSQPQPLSPHRSSSVLHPLAMLLSQAVAGRQLLVGEAAPSRYITS
jgi:hypothetical protein